MKSICHHFWRAIIEVNKKILGGEGESPTLKKLVLVSYKDEISSW